jgi:hypothetical protein
MFSGDDIEFHFDQEGDHINFRFWIYAFSPTFFAFFLPSSSSAIQSMFHNVSPIFHPYFSKKNVTTPCWAEKCRRVVLNFTKKV